MTCGPVPGMAKVIVSRPGCAFAFVIACRSEPAPLSFVFVTTRLGAPPLSATAWIETLSQRNSAQLSTFSTQATVNVWPAEAAR